jgi:hypothetical protein
VTIRIIVRSLCTIFGLCAALAFSQERPLDNIASRQYQHEIRPLRLALDGWLQKLGLQEFGLSMRLVKASYLPENTCGMSSYNVQSLIGEIDVLRSDEYEKLPGCLDAVDIQHDQLNTVIHEVLHMVMNIPVTEEGSARFTPVVPARKPISRGHCQSSVTCSVLEVIVGLPKGGVPHSVKVPIGLLISSRGHYHCDFVN